MHSLNFLAIYMAAILGATTKAQVMSHPASAIYSVNAFAIGDWGTTETPSSCCSRRSDFTNYDVNAESVVATLMDFEARDAVVAPKVVIGHGDSFYWTGIINLALRDSRITTTFEEKFNGPYIRQVPWVNVMGNHDYGGSSYLCNEGDTNVKCENTTSLLEALDNKFFWQSSYVSPQDNRWILEHHFYVHRIENPDTGISIDIINVDTNDADVNGAIEICCQCYGYSQGNNTECRGADRGHKFCCGGDTDMFDACMAKLDECGEDSRTQLVKQVKESNATHTFVNSHYSPYNHYTETGMKKWFEALRDLNVIVWLNGHTHSEGCTYSPQLRIHFLENGAGGGAQNEATSRIPPYASEFVEDVWKYSGNEYGFMSLQASQEWIKLQYHTADDSWVFGKDIDSTKVGGVVVKFCWYIPADGTKGRAC